MQRVVIVGNWDWLKRVNQADLDMDQTAAPKVSFVSLGCR